MSTNSTHPETAAGKCPRMIRNCWPCGAAYCGKPDPITALVRLRATLARLSHEVDALADESGIAGVRRAAPLLANRIRDAVMVSEMVEASRR